MPIRLVNRHATQFHRLRGSEEIGKVVCSFLPASTTTTSTRSARISLLDFRSRLSSFLNQHFEFAPSFSPHLQHDTFKGLKGKDCANANSLLTYTAASSLDALSCPALPVPRGYLAKISIIKLAVMPARRGRSKPPLFASCRSFWRPTPALF
jgi:hypothetical protein